MRLKLWEEIELAKNRVQEVIGDGFLFLNDVYDPDFPGETFHVLKGRKRGCGEYRTRRLVLEAWDNMELMHKSNSGRWDLL